MNLRSSLFAVLIMLVSNIVITAETVSAYRSVIIHTNEYSGLRAKYLKNGFQNDTLQVLVKIKNSLPVNWGTMYQCKLQKVIKGLLSGIDSSFIMSASAGSEQIFPGIDLLKTNEIYFIEFIKSERTTNEPYLPAGTTGMMDKKGTIWDIMIQKR